MTKLGVGHGAVLGISPIQTLAPPLLAPRVEDSGPVVKRLEALAACLVMVPRLHRSSLRQRSMRALSPVVTLGQRGANVKPRPWRQPPSGPITVDGPPPLSLHCNEKEGEIWDQ